MTKLDELQAALDAAQGIPDSPRGGNDYMKLGTLGRLLRRNAADLLSLAQVAKRISDAGYMQAHWYNDMADLRKVVARLTEESK